MFGDITDKVIKWFTEPISEPLRKSPKMVKAHTEAEILKAEEDFKKHRSRPAAKSSRGSVRLVRRYYPEEENFFAHSHLHVAHGPLWDSQIPDVPASSIKKNKHQKP